MIIVDLFFAARPMLQVPIWTVYLVCLHYHHRLSGQSFDGVDLLIMASLSLLFTGAAYLNQVYDKESDRLNRKPGFLERGLLRPDSLLNGAVAVLLLPLAVAPLISLTTFLIFAQLVLLAYVYSVPPLRLKDRPLGGLFGNAYAPGFLVSMAVMPEITVDNAGLLGWDNPFYFTLAVGGTYVLTTIPDRAGDAATGKRTPAVVLGRSGALAVAPLLMLGAAWIALRSGHDILLYLALVGTLLALLALVVRSGRVVLLAAKLPVLLLTLLAGYYYPIYLAFIVALIIGCRIYYRRRFDVVYPVLT